MSRFLRYPVESIREPFGKAGLIVACLALVLALTGAAFAAGKLTGPQKKEVEKIAKKFAGKPGVTGPQGDPGLVGAPGKDGTNGINGKDGKSVVSTSFSGAAEPAGEPCKEQGGTEFEVEHTSSSEVVCNGQTGYTETLPSRKTETGVIVLFANTSVLNSSISFNIPLPAALDGTHVHEINNSTGEELVQTTTPGNSPAVKEQSQSVCLGNATAPSAEPGNLCIYRQLANGVEVENPAGEKEGFVLQVRNTNTFATGADTAGAWLSQTLTGSSSGAVIGVWAVTAP